MARSFKEVDKNRTAITGISWGGYLTCLVSGIDNRFKAGVPVYGCGYIYEFPEVWSEYIGNNDNTQKRWIEIFDPSKSLEYPKFPLFFINSPKDPYYPLKIWSKSVKTARMQCLLDANLGHGYYFNIPEIEGFISSKINKKHILPELGALQVNAGKVSCKIIKGAINSAKLFFTTTVDKPKWQDFAWESIDAKITGQYIQAKIPADARAVYMLAIDKNSMRVSTNAIILK